MGEIREPREVSKSKKGLHQKLSKTPHGQGEHTGKIIRPHRLEMLNSHAGHFLDCAGERFTFVVGVARMHLGGVVTDDAAADFLGNVEVGQC